MQVICLQDVFISFSSKEMILQKSEDDLLTAITVYKFHLVQRILAWIWLNIERHAQTY